MNKNWTDLLDDDICERLANCSSVKKDIVPLVQAKWSFYKESKKYTKEDILIGILELLDCNSRYFDLTEDEYKEILSTVN